MRFVLVHGACHGAWCWDLVIPELAARGHSAVAVELPGHGTRVAEAASLAAYREAVVAELRAGDVLVGHSMGCAVAAIAADASLDGLRQVIFLAGPLPGDGEPLAQLAVGWTADAARTPTVSDQNKRFSADRTRYWFDRDGARETFFHDCDDDVADWAAARLTPQQVAPFLEPISAPRLLASGLSRTYIRCQQDRAWPLVAADQQSARLGVEPLSIDTAHSPFLNRPVELVDLFVHAVGAQ